MVLTVPKLRKANRATKPTSARRPIRVVTARATPEATPSRSDVVGESWFLAWATCLAGWSSK